MSNLKKIALGSVILMGMAVSAGASASSNATVIWSGIVPVTRASDDIIITGLAGSTTAPTGTVTSSADGVFLSDTIVLESHLNDGTASAPTIGGLASANWTLIGASVTYDGIANPAQLVEVDINGTKVNLGDSISGVETISTKIMQTALLPEAEVSGTTVQAAVTVIADIV